MSAHFESAISRLRPTTERRAITTAVATLPAAQNGTSGALADGKHARRWPACAMPRPIDPGHLNPGFGDGCLTDRPWYC